MRSKRYDVGGGADARGTTSRDPTPGDGRVGKQHSQACRLKTRTSVERQPTMMTPVYPFRCAC